MQFFVQVCLKYFSDCPRPYELIRTTPLIDRVTTRLTLTAGKPLLHHIQELFNLKKLPRKKYLCFWNYFKIIKTNLFNRQCLYRYSRIPQDSTTYQPFPDLIPNTKLVQCVLPQCLDPVWITAADWIVSLSLRCRATQDRAQLTHDYNISNDVCIETYCCT